MTQDKLIAIIAQILELPPEQVHETSGVNETENWDSLKNMMIMMEIENRYGLRFDFDRYFDAATVKDIRALVEAAQVG